MKSNRFVNRLSLLLAIVMLAVTCIPAMGLAEGPSVTTEKGTYTPENPYTLYFTYYDLVGAQEGTEEVNKAICEYVRENYCIDLQLYPFDFYSAASQVPLMLAGGDPLDVVVVYSSFINSYVNMGGLYDMTALLQGEDGQQIKDTIGEELATLGVLGDITYGIPSVGQASEFSGFVLNKRMCDELGFKEKYNLSDSPAFDGTVHSYQELEEMFAAVKEAYPNVIPFNLGSNSMIRNFYYYDMLQDSFGVLNCNGNWDTTEIVNLFEMPEYYDIVKMLARWYDLGYIYPEAATTNFSYDLMNSEAAFSGMFNLGLVQGGDLSAMLTPEMYYMVTGNEGFTGGACTYSATKAVTSIANQSQDPEMAFKFIRALYTDPQLMNLFLYGVEGLSYKVNEDGTFTYADGQDGTNCKYHMTSAGFLGNQYISAVWNPDGTRAASYWEDCQKEDEWGKRSAAFGFNWDASAYSEQLAALNNAQSAYLPYIETGTVGEANLDAMLEQLNSALYASGLQEVMDAKQAQLNAWLASKK